MDQRRRRPDGDHRVAPKGGPRSINVSPEEIALVDLSMVAGPIAYSRVPPESQAVIHNARDRRGLLPVPTRMDTPVVLPMWEHFALQIDNRRYSSVRVMDCKIEADRDLPGQGYGSPGTYDPLVSPVTSVITLRLVATGPGEVVTNKSGL